MIGAIDLGMLVIEYAPHAHITEGQAKWRAEVVKKAARVGSLWPWSSFWNTIYSAKIGSCSECGRLYKEYTNQKYDLK